MLVDKTGKILAQISIVDRTDLPSSTLLVRVNAGVDMNLSALDAFIGELITWRDRYAELIKDKPE